MEFFCLFVLFMHFLPILSVKGSALKNQCELTGMGILWVEQCNLCTYYVTLWKADIKNKRLQGLSVNGKPIVWVVMQTLEVKLNSNYRVNSGEMFWKEKERMLISLSLSPSFLLTTNSETTSGQRGTRGNSQEEFSGSQTTRLASSSCGSWEPPAF